MDAEFKLPEQFNNGSDQTINKLILLFFFDKMEVPMTEESICDICSATNEWIPYMDCTNILSELNNAGFLYERKTSSLDSLYSITPEGIDLLGHFYTRIPISLRDTITEFVKENRMKYKRIQEYKSDYMKNDDGTYTVLLEIIDVVKPVMRLEFSVPNRQVALNIHKNWKNKAAQVYSAIYESLME